MGSGVFALPKVAAMVIVCTVASAGAAAGQAPTARTAEQTPPSVTQEIVEQLRQLRNELDALREQVAQERRQSEALRQELATLRDSLAQDQQLVNAKLDEHEQAKVESGSKYNVRLSGLVLFNLLSTAGSVDSLDQPLSARLAGAADNSGSFAASLRQSFVSLDVFGPSIGGGKTAGHVSVDFFGGFPDTTDGLSAPYPRLRTAGMRVDWARASVFAGQEAPFFSPRSPTSLFSTAYPAFSSSGNLWTWTPEVYVTARRARSSGSQFTFSAGILDPFTGQAPGSEYDRLPTAGERTSTPAVAMHAGYSGLNSSRPVELGAGAYYSNQDWGLDRSVGAWAATADWDIPLGSVLSISGEVYKGRAIGGLGGGLSASVLLDGVAAQQGVVPIESKGGWAQLKVSPSNRLELNGAWGGDWPTCSSSCDTVAVLERERIRRNATASANAIYQLRSNVTFSIEYRRLATTVFGERRATANHFSVNTGLGF